MSQTHVPAGPHELPQPAAGYQIAIVVPTLNEAPNIRPLLNRTLRAIEGAGLDARVIVVDGGSTDGTQELVRSWEARGPVRLLESDGRRGLSGDVLFAVRATDSPIVVVMDGDLSHAPEYIPSLVRPLLEGTHDVAVGSRYVPQGGVHGWPWRRRVISRAAAACAWPLTELKDPTSGFFAARREHLLAHAPAANGFKLGLEVIVRGGPSLRVVEVPIVFTDRWSGSSKLGAKVVWHYLMQLVQLAGGGLSFGTSWRFAVVGLLGMAIDMAVFQALFSAGFQLGLAHIAGFVGATVFNYSLNARWGFAAAAVGSAVKGWARYVRYFAVCLLALFLRAGVLTSLVQLGSVPVPVAAALAILVAATVNYAGCAFFVFAPALRDEGPQQRWRIATLGIVAYMLLFRLAYMGALEIIPEEAYYWNYSRHLDIGYLDHPPMVAWLIAAGTRVFGESEFGVRIGAVACWLVTASFLYRLARDQFDKVTALCTLMLLAVLPFFFGTGLLITPDAPLCASWAVALFMLDRALLRGKRLAWWGFGLAIGLGMLSKYTISLLVPAAVVFAVLHRPSRRWLRRPEPYAGMLLAAAVFLPVIVWNIRNGWASFVFQGPRRFSGEAQFSLQELLGFVVALLTPTGLAAACLAILSDKAVGAIRGAVTSQQAAAQRARRLFTLVFTLVPLSVFVYHSLRHSPRLNWTGPSWMALLPVIAYHIAHTKIAKRQGFPGMVRHAWAPTIAITILLYGGFAHYAALGFPGVGYPPELGAVIGWRDLGAQIEQIEEQVKSQTGSEPLIVGLDEYMISSEIAFYDDLAERREGGDAASDGAEAGKLDGPDETAGRHLFGRGSLMYAYWFPAVDQVGRNVILVDRNAAALEKPNIARCFNRMDEVRELVVRKNGREVMRYYYRIGYDYRCQS